MAIGHNLGIQSDYKQSPKSLGRIARFDSKLHSCSRIGGIMDESEVTFPAKLI
jgi:hypothetical protein